MTPEQQRQLESDIVEMRKAQLPQADIDAYVDGQLRQFGSVPTGPTSPVFGATRGTPVSEPRFMDPTKSREDALRQLGTFAGGSAGAGLTARSGNLVQTLAEGVGTFIGDVAAKVPSRGGEALSGESLRESASTAVGSATLGGVGRGAIRLMGDVGGVPRFATQEAGVPTAGLPSYQKTGLLPRSSPGPTNVNQLRAGYSAEGVLADRARAAVSKLVKKFTPERTRKTQLLKDAGAAGARVDMNPIIDKLIDQEIPNAVTDAAKAHNAAISRTVDELATLYNKKGGFLSPAEADEMIRRQLDSAAYKASGDPSTTSIGVALHEVRTVAVEELNRALPEEVAALNKKISVKLDKVDAAERLFGADRAGVENKLRNLYNPGNSDNIEALNFLAKESGDKRLALKNLKTATKREFTTDIRQPSETRGRPFRTVFEGGAKLGTKIAAPLQPYIGGTAAALFPNQMQWLGEAERMAAEWAFRQAMNPRNNP